MQEAPRNTCRPADFTAEEKKLLNWHIEFKKRN